MGQMITAPLDQLTLAPPAAAPDYGYGNRYNNGDAATAKPKGLGFLGPLQRPDGGVMSEYSIGMQIGGKETEIPSLVPTLTKEEVRLILSSKDGDKLPASVYQKARAYAEQRIKAGKDPFAGPGEQQALYPEFARSATPPTPGASAGPITAPVSDLTVAPTPDAGIVDTAKDVAVGAAKGLGNTVFGLGKLFHDYTPVGRISDAILPGTFDQRPPELVPNNTAQRVGYTGEQVGEFFLPTGAVGKVGKAAEVAKAGALTMMQGGTPTEAGVSSALTAVIPGSSALRSKAAGALEASAEKSVAQSLGATKEWAKAEAAKLAPKILEKGVKGSRAAMLTQAEAMTKVIGDQIGKEYQAAAAAGQVIDGGKLSTTLAAATDAFHTTTAAGARVPIPGTEAVVAKLTKLEKFVTSLGPDIPVDKAAAVKTTWDRIISKAGFFGPKATASATDNANAWALREAAGSIRELIASGNPTIADLNKEYAFWKGLRGVLTETERRTQSQSGGLVAGITGATGAAAGFAEGDSLGDKFEKAMIGGFMGKQVVKLLQSPGFRTQVSAPFKMALADAIAKGDQSLVLRTIGRITASVPGLFQPVPVP